MMFSRKSLLVTIYVFTLLADIKITTSSKFISNHGYGKAQQVAACCSTCPVVQYPTSSAVQCCQNWQGVCPPSAAGKPATNNPAMDNCRGVGGHNSFGNVIGYNSQSYTNGYNTDPRFSNGYSHVSPPTIQGTHLNYQHSGSYNDPHRISYNGNFYNNLYSSGTDPSSNSPVFGYPGYLVYGKIPHNAHNSAQGGPLDSVAGEDPQCETLGEDPEWDTLEDPQWETSEDPEWGTEEDPDFEIPTDPRDFSPGVRDMISRMAQGLMGFTNANPANENPVPGIADFASSQGNNIPQLANANPIPNVADFAAPPDNVVPQLTDPDIADFTVNPANDISQVSTNPIPDFSDFVVTQGNDIPQPANANQIPDLASFLASQPNGVSPQLTDTNPEFTDFVATQGNSIQRLSPNPLQDTNSIPEFTDFVATQGNSIQRLSSNPLEDTNSVPEFTDFVATQGNSIQRLSSSPLENTNSVPEFTDFVATQGNSIQRLSSNPLEDTNSVPEFTDFVATQGNSIQRLSSNPLEDTNSEPEFTDFVATQGNSIQQLSSNPLEDTNSVPEFTDFVATQENTIPRLLSNDNQDFEDFVGGDTTQSGGGLTESNPVSDITEYGNTQSYNDLESTNPSIINILSNNKNIGIAQKSNSKHLANPSFDGYSTLNYDNGQIINGKIPLQIIFKSNGRRDGVQISKDLVRNVNNIRSNNPPHGSKSICDAIRNSAEIFNIPHINLKPFLVLTPKNLTRSSLSETDIESYITAEEMEALYDESVNNDKSVKVLFLPNFQLSEKQIQNIVNSISLEIFKEEGNECKDLVLIPLDLSNNKVTILSNDNPSRVIQDSSTYGHSGEINYQQQPSETTPSSSSGDFETCTGFSGLTIPTSQTCQALTTEPDLCSSPPSPNPHPPIYPNTPPPCPTSPSDGLSLPIFAPPGNVPVTEYNKTASDYNQQSAIQEENCSIQPCKAIKYPTKIFILNFNSIDDNTVLDKNVNVMQQNGSIAKFNIVSENKRTRSGETFSTDVTGSVTCPEEKMHSNYNLKTQHSELSSCINQTSTISKFEPVNNVVMKDYSREHNMNEMCNLEQNEPQIKNSQDFQDSTNLKEEEKSVPNEETSSFKIITHSIPENSRGSLVPQDCATKEKLDDRESHPIKVITYPFSQNLGDTSTPKNCEASVTSRNSCSKHVEVPEDPYNRIGSEAINSNRGKTKEYCQNLIPTVCEQPVINHQTFCPKTYTSTLNLINKNSKINDYINPVKNQTIYPKTSINSLDLIKKNAKMDDFVIPAREKNTITEGSNQIFSIKNDSPLLQTPQENKVKQYWDSKKIHCSSPSGNRSDKVNLSDNQDPPTDDQFIAETKATVPKCPSSSSKIYIVKINNSKLDGSCCGTVSSTENINDTQSNHNYSKDYGFLSKSLTMHQQQIHSLNETTDKEDLSLKKPCANTTPYSQTPQKISVDNFISTNDFTKPNEIVPQEKTHTKVWENVQNRDYSTTQKQACERSMDKTKEVDHGSQLSINKNCHCNLKNAVIEQQENVSEKSDSSTHKVCINTAPSPPMCQKIDVPKVIPPSHEHYNKIEIPIFKPTAQTLPMPQEIPELKICPSSDEHTKKIEIPIFKPHILPMPQKIPVPDISASCDKHTTTIQTPIFKPTAQTLPTPQKIPEPKICPPSDDTKKIEIPILKPTAQTHQPQKIPGSNICPSSDEHAKKIEIPIFKLTAQTLPMPQKIPVPRMCASSDKHTTTIQTPTFKPTAQTFSMPQKIPEPKICPPSDEHTRKIEIPIFKPTAQTHPPQKIPGSNICPPSDEHAKKIDIPIVKPSAQTLPMPQIKPVPKMCASFDEHTKTIETPIINPTAQTLPMPQEIQVSNTCPPVHEYIRTYENNPQPTEHMHPTPQKIPLPKICPPNDEHIKTNEEVPKPIAQTKDWGMNIVHSTVESASCEKNSNPHTKIDHKLEPLVNESCLCKLKAAMDKHRISSGKTSGKKNEITQLSYGVATSPPPQNDPVLTNCIPTDEQTKTNEIIPPAVEQTKDWNISSNGISQVDNTSYRGDMKPTTVEDCKKCQKRRKELLAKILKEVFINNLDLLCEEKKS